MLTEIGWSSVQWVDGKEISMGGHIRVKEYDSYRNGKYVEDNKEVSACSSFA